jgi:ATP-dependent Lhr-like helicase
LACPPAGLPESPLEPTAHAAHDLARRYARTHGPFATTDFAARTRRPRDGRDGAARLAASGRLLEGEFRREAQAGNGDPDVLQSIRRRSLARLRRQIEPVDPPVLTRLLTSWQGVVRKRAGRRAARRH